MSATAKEVITVAGGSRKQNSKSGYQQHKTVSQSALEGHYSICPESEK